MTKGLTAHQSTSQITCEICGCAINHPDTLLITDPEYPVCRAFDCRKNLGHKSSMNPALFKAHIAFQRKLHAERINREAKQKKHIEEVTARENKEHKQVLRSVLDNHPALNKNNLHMLVIPSGMTQLTPLPNERVADYTQHLTNIIKQAADYTCAADVVQDQHYVAHEKLAKLEQQFAKYPTLHTISDRVCSLCRGGCCASGKEHAYLSVITMRRYMDNYPAMTQQALVDKYLSHIPPETIEDSCINQTTTGCALPRELRSDICNKYYCSALKQYQALQIDRVGTDSALVIQRSATHWNQFNPQVHNDINRVALIDEHKTHIIPVSLPASTGQINP